MSTTAILPTSSSSGTRRRARVASFGDIPAHWEERRAKYYMREIDERSADGSEELLSVSHITGVTPRSQKNVTMFMAETYAGHKLCRPGDLVVNTMWAWMGALGVSRHTGLVSPSYAVYRLVDSESFDRTYLDHLLRTREYTGEFMRRSTGIRSSRLRLYPDQFLDVPLIRPSLAEQRAIASYIRHVDALITRVLRTKRQQLTLLEEQWKVLLDNYISGGFDSTSDRQESRIAGVPSIPSHWTESKVKHIARYINGYAFKPSQWSGDGLPIIRIQNLTGDEATYNYFSGELPEKFRVVPGDILLSWSASLGVHVWQREEAWLNQHIFKVIPDESQVRRDYYVWLAKWLIDYMAQEAHGSTMQHITKEKFGALWVYLPPLPEQREIAAKLRSMADRNAQIAATLEEEIVLSLSLRERLIADAVFGRITVPDRLEVDEPDESDLADLIPMEDELEVIEDAD